MSLRHVSALKGPSSGCTINTINIYRFVEVGSHILQIYL